MDEESLINYINKLHYRENRCLKETLKSVFRKTDLVRCMKLRGLISVLQYTLSGIFLKKNVT